MAKKPLSHKIDENAMRILHSAFDNIGVVNRIDPDYGIDFKITLLDKNDEVTPKAFQVQLKGKEGVEFVRENKFVSIQMKKSRIKYCMDIYSEPVFLFVIDVKEYNLYWLYMQGYPDKKQPESDWGDLVSKGSKSLCIPIENCINVKKDVVCKGMDLFLEGFESAVKHLRDLYPGSPAAALKAEEERYSSIDPRFKVNKWDIVSNKPSPIFTTTSKVKLRMNVKTDTPERKSKYEDLLNRGELVEFDPGEISISGSPLFRDHSEGSVKLQIAKKIHVEISLVLCKEEQSKEICIDGFDGYISGGMKIHRIDASLGHGIMDIRHELSPTENEQVTGKFTLSIGYHKWLKRPVMDLSHFNSIHELFLGVGGNSELFLSIFFTDDNRHVRLPISIDAGKEELSQTQNILEKIFKARAISKSIGENFTIDIERFDEDAACDIDRIYQIISEGNRKINCENFKMTIVGNKSTCSYFSEGEIVNGIKRDGCESIDWVVNGPLMIGKFSQHFNELVIHEIRKSEEDTEPHSKQYEIELRGNSNTYCRESIELENPCYKPELREEKREG